MVALLWPGERLMGDRYYVAGLEVKWAGGGGGSQVVGVITVTDWTCGQNWWMMLL